MGKFFEFFGVKKVDFKEIDALEGLFLMYGPSFF